MSERDPHDGYRGPQERHYLRSAAPSQMSALLSRVLGRTKLQLLSYPTPSRLWGKFANLKLPSHVLQFIIRLLSRWRNIRLDGLDLSKFGTLDEFFTRDLKENIDIHDSTFIVCADGVLSACGLVCGDMQVQAKGKIFSLSELIADGHASSALVGGVTYTVYLSPADSHHVYSPVTGFLTRLSYLPGRLFPVYEASRASINRLFSRNERVALFIQSDLGLVVVVLVGATLAGSIGTPFADLRSNAHFRRAPNNVFLDPPVMCRAGQHVGTFHLGSTVLVFHQKRFDMKELLIGSRVRAGRRIV